MLNVPNNCCWWSGTNGKPPFLNFWTLLTPATAKMKTTMTHTHTQSSSHTQTVRWKLWRLWRVQNCDQTFFQRRCVPMGVCFSTMLPSRLAPPPGSALSAKVSFQSVCMSYECVSIRLMFALCLSCSGPLILVIHKILCSNTHSTQDNLKRKAYRKKNSKVYINICVYEMTKCSRFI